MSDPKIVRVDPERLRVPAPRALPVPSPRAVAVAVCSFLEGSSAERVMAPQRGTPRTAYLRALSMLIWRDLHPVSPSFSATGRAWGRDRRNVARGLQRVVDDGLPRELVLQNIIRRLR